MKNQKTCEAAKECLNLLEKGYKVDTHTEIPAYDGEIWGLVKAIHDDEHFDFDYLKNYRAIQDTEPERLTLEEMYTELSFMARAERFNPGTIAYAINCGRLQKLLVHFLEVQDAC